jgi:hypothetical protein
MPMFLKGKFMSNNHARSLVILLCLSLLAAGLGCGAGQVLAPVATHTSTPTITYTPTLTLTPTATLTPTPTPTSTPTPPPVQARGWESAAIAAVCLEVQQTYTNVEGEFSLPLEPIVIRLLQQVNIQAVRPGSLCDASLTIQVTAEALGATYNDIGRCYSGTSVNSRATLVAEGYNPLKTAPYSVYEAPWFLIFSNDCQKEPSDAPFDESATATLLGNLLQIWGKPVLLAALGDESDDVRRSVIHAIKEPEARAAGLETDDIVSLLIMAFHDESCDISDLAAMALGDLGPAAKDAVPDLHQALMSSGETECGMMYGTYSLINTLGKIGPASREAIPDLIQMLETEEDEFITEEIVSALRKITGQNFGTDASAWQEWWDSQE